MAEKIARKYQFNYLIREGKKRVRIHTDVIVDILKSTPTASNNLIPDNYQLLIINIYIVVKNLLPFLYGVSIIASSLYL